MQQSKKLLGPISIISIAYLSSRLLGFLREILLAKWTGVSTATDTFDLAFIIPDFLFYLSAGGYLAITIIPILSDLKQKNSENLNDYFLSLLYGLSFIFVFISFIFFVFKNDIGSILEVQNLTLFSKVFAPIVFSQAFFFIGAILMSYQYFHNDFRYPALAPVIYNFSIILFGWLNSSTPESTVYGFALGGFIGSVVGHFLIQVIGVKKNGLMFRLVSPKLKHVKEYLTVSLPLIVGQSIAVMDEQLFRVFGSFLSAGSVASFRYARRIALLPVGIVAQAVGVASYPTLSKLFVEKKFEELKTIIRTQLSSLLLFNAVMVLILIINSEEIISIVYERGKFSNADVMRVSSILKIVALGVIPWSLNQIVNRSYYVQKSYWFPVGIGTLATMATTITLFLTNSPSETNYSIIIISFLWAYTAFMLFSLKIGGESVLNRDLIYDIFLCLLFSGIIYLVLVNINLNFQNTIYNLVVTSIIVIISFFVSMNIIRMRYVQFKRRK
ncbi:MAG: lipid II flippase MurJ [Actinomycetota bacterium]|nr:lipid II flippase MurJ [Actinomycetota bacterium]